MVADCATTTAHGKHRPLLRPCHLSVGSAQRKVVRGTSVGTCLESKFLGLAELQSLFAAAKAFARRHFQPRKCYTYERNTFPLLSRPFAAYHVNRALSSGVSGLTSFRLF